MFSIGKNAVDVVASSTTVHLPHQKALTIAMNMR